MQELLEIQSMGGPGRKETHILGYTGAVSAHSLLAPCYGCDGHTGTHPVLPLMKHLLPQLQGELSADSLQLSAPSGIALAAKSHLAQSNGLPGVAHIQ